MVNRTFLKRSCDVAVDCNFEFIIIIKFAFIHVKVLLTTQRNFTKRKNEVKHA